MSSTVTGSGRFEMEIIFECFSSSPAEADEYGKRCIKRLCSGLRDMVDDVVSEVLILGGREDVSEVSRQQAVSVENGMMICI